LYRDCIDFLSFVKKIDTLQLSSRPRREANLPSPNGKTLETPPGEEEGVKRHFWRGKKTWCQSKFKKSLKQWNSLAVQGLNDDNQLPRHLLPPDGSIWGIFAPTPYTRHFDLGGTNDSRSGFPISFRRKRTKNEYSVSWHFSYRNFAIMNDLTHIRKNSIEMTEIDFETVIANFIKRAPTSL
jgi:hypothetical protein